MKKLTAMLLSLLMCLSLMTIPAQARFTPDPDGPGIIDIGGAPTDPGDDDPDEPGVSSPLGRLPDPVDEMPVDD